MTGAQLRARWRRGERAFGTMLTSAVSTRGAWMLRRLGLDLAVVDTEHTTLAAAEVENMVAAIGLVGCVPFVRIPARDPLGVTRVLDAGTQGVVIPYCETLAEVTLCVEAARWYPARPARPVQASAKTPRQSLPAKTPSVVESANRHVVVVVGIESAPALSILDSLLSVEGIDAVFVGTHDLARSIGAPDDLEHPSMKRAFAHVLRACAKRDIAVAIWPLPLKLAQYWMARGMTFVLHSSDQQAMFEGFDRDFQRLRGVRSHARSRRSP